MRTLAPLLLAAILLTPLVLARIDARAGSYTVSYSANDTAKITPNNLPPSQQSYLNYGSVPGGYGVSVTVNGGGSSSATANAGITATLTWQPAYAGEQPPLNVIVAETATASGNSGASPVSAGGSVSDSLGSNEVLSGPGSYSFVSGGTTLYEFGQSETGTRYTIRNGATITVSCAPSATASSGPGGGASASVVYSVTGTPVVINLSGTTQDSSGNQNILIGQFCSAGLNVGSYSAENYQWTVNGYTFASFNVASDLSSGHMADVLLGTWILPTPGWYWRKDETDAVECTAAVYAGSVFVGNVTADTSVSVQAPSYSFAVSYGQVVIGNAPNAPLDSSGHPIYAPGIAASGTGPSVLSGSNWLGTVSTPFLFTNGGTTSLGDWRYVQLFLSPGRTKYNPYAYACSQNGVPGLDTSYPYPARSTDAFGDGVGWYGDGNPHQDGDTPATDLSDVCIHIVINESYQVFLMYLPPGASSSWVPIDVEPWMWAADCLIPGNPPSWKYWTADPAGTVGFATGNTSGRTYNFPDWNLVEGPGVFGTYW